MVPFVAQLGAPALMFAGYSVVAGPDRGVSGGLFLHPATVLDERQGLGFAVAETRGCVATLNRVQEI